MPGSPPISTNEPSTRPPPNIRSTSSLFRDMRFSTDESISDSGIGLRPAPGTLSAAAGFLPVATVSSTIVFHSPHAGHLPIHLGLSLPQDLQNHTVFVFTLAIASFLSWAKIQNPLTQKKILPDKGQYPSMSRLMSDYSPLQQSTAVLSQPLQSEQASDFSHPSCASPQHSFLSAQSLVHVVQSFVQAASSAALLLLQQHDEAANIAAATANAINTFFIIYCFLVLIQQK